MKVQWVEPRLLGTLGVAPAVGRAFHEDDATSDTAAVVTIDDDGPGLDPALGAAVLQRGVRADESGHGSGLGLAIVRDLVELYAGAIALSVSPLGGLRVELRLPT